MRWLITTILLGLLLATLSLSWRLLRPPQEPLQMVLDPWPSNELLWLAHERGFFSAEGLEMRVIEMGSSSDASGAFARGKADLFVATPAELARIAGSTGPQPKVVLALNWSAGADVVLARVGVDSLAALKGRTVAYEPDGLTAHLLQRALESVRLTWNDITPVPMTTASMPAAFAAGTVDALVSYPPWSTSMLQAGRVHALFDSRQIPKEICDLLIVRADILRQFPDLTARLTRIWDRTLALLEIEATWGEMAKRERFTADELRRSLREGIHLIQASEQAAFIAADGPLSKIFPLVSQSLRLSGSRIDPADPAACLLPYAPEGKDR